MTIKVDKAKLRIFYKDLLRNLIVASYIFVPLLFIDLLTKGLVFDGDESGNTSASIQDWIIIGFRSQFHKSTTFLDFIGRTLPYWASLLINYTLIVIFLSMFAFSRDKFLTIALCVSLAGIFGNTIDASIYQGVRNVLYVPWTKNGGTFNFADACVVVGAFLSVFAYILVLWPALKFWKKSATKKQTQDPQASKADEELSLESQASTSEDYQQPTSSEDKERDWFKKDKD